VDGVGIDKSQAFLELRFEVDPAGPDGRKVLGPLDRLLREQVEAGVLGVGLDVGEAGQVDQVVDECLQFVGLGAGVADEFGGQRVRVVLPGCS